MYAATSLALAFGLSLDSFAAALCRGASRRVPVLRDAILVGGVFGVCQAATPLVGWGIGSAFAELVSAIDHWIAFVLLAGVGGMMIRASFEHDGTEQEEGSGFLALLLTGLATSIDAAAVGVGLGAVENDITMTIALIGLVTFSMAALGIRLGRSAGTALGHWAELAGGLVLVAIGAKILIEHTLI